MAKISKMSVNFYKKIEQELQSLGFNITNADLQRPWGAFYYIDENQAQDFQIIFLMV